MRSSQLFLTIGARKRQRHCARFSRKIHFCRTVHSRDKFELPVSICPCLSLLITNWSSSTLYHSLSVYSSKRRAPLRREMGDVKGMKDNLSSSAVLQRENREKERSFDINCCICQMKIVKFIKEIFHKIKGQCQLLIVTNVIHN